MESGGKSYELTGDREDELKQYVGQRVEITGSVDRADTGSSASGMGTSGSGTSSSGTSTSGSSTSGSSTSGTPSTSGTGTSASGSSAYGAGDRNLPRLTITSFRAVSGSCPSASNR
jgi:hypothetical protein